ncbi:MAG TPA: hypothetical protein VNF99_11090, partial [Stellaceae bacterium]|nr:hypothetical protein [Stellaceae bacterium]
TTRSSAARPPVTSERSVADLHSQIDHWQRQVEQAFSSAIQRMRQLLAAHGIDHGAAACTRPAPPSEKSLESRVAAE